jgi:hypothetical protein
MSWRRDRDAEREHEAFLVETLTRDDDPGYCLGGIMQFYEGHVCYGHVHIGQRVLRIGACHNAAAARRAVERRLEGQP